MPFIRFVFTLMVQFAGAALWFLRRLGRKLASVSPKTWIKLSLIPLGIALFFYLLTFLISAALSRIAVLEFLLMLAPKEKLSGVNVLVLGVDNTAKVQRADTLMVIHLDSEKNRIGVLSIPRDTRVQIPDIGWTKINHAYAYGGVPLTRQTVSDFIRVPIDYHIKVDMSGVEALIDQIGGVTVEVPKDLYYMDQAGDLYIDFKKGNQTLNGKQAVQYLRFRHDGKADLGRIERQQSFVQAFAQKMLDSGNTTELPIILGKMSRMVDTDMSSRQIAGLALQFRDAFHANRLDTATLPGSVALIGGVSYWRPDLATLDKVVGQTLMGFGSIADKEVVAKIKTEDKDASKDSRRNMTLKEVNWLSKQTDLDKPKQQLKQDKLIVEILNGYGGIGEANRLAAHLKKFGITVKRTGNAASFNYKETLIVDWKGKMDSSLALSQLLSIDPTKIIVYDRPEKTLGITIVLGKDWLTSKQHIYTQKPIQEAKPAKAATP